MDNENNLSRKRDRIKNWMTPAEPKNMVQPIGVNDDDEGTPTPEQPDRMRPKFDELFSGMPSLGDILTPPPQVVEKANTDTQQTDDWFEKERQEIIASYEKVKEQMLRELEEERLKDPESFPDTAKAMLESVLQQEMEQEIAETLEARAQEQLVEYERQQLSKLEQKEDDDVVTERVQDLMDASEAEYQRQLQSRTELDDFLRYEAEAFRKAEDARRKPSQENSSADLQPPPYGSDLDLWALERLQSMMDDRASDDSDVLDILEGNIEDLKERIEKEAGRSTVQPETMKEWQMYRAIATQLAQNDELLGKKSAETKEEKRVREERIFQLLDSWKDYVAKEEGIREESGLARGPKLPFEWQERGNEDKDPPASTTTGQSKADIRRQVNRMSVEVMENLLMNSDPSRREKLQKEVDYLKQALQSNDYLDIDEDLLADPNEELEPVDIQDLLAQPTPENAKPSAAKASSRLDESAGAIQEKPEPPPTPYFQEEDQGDVPRQEPPNTPFFSEPEQEKEALSTDSRLGSMEDQKLEAMFRRAGARTVEEQAAIRKQYEQFREVEKAKRDATGLSGDDAISVDTEEAGLKYSVSDVVTEDGDFDAEKILSTIGPRPQRKKKSSRVNKAPQEDGAELQSDIDEEDVMSSMYRSVAAVGGGRYKDDPEKKAQQRASYSEYVDLEEEMRQNLEDEPTVDEGLIREIQAVGDVEYADEALALLGDRPSPKRTRIMDEAELSDRNYDDDDDSDDTQVSDNTASSEFGASSLDDKSVDMPEWLRRENEGTEVGARLLGGEVPEPIDETDYEERQRQLAEYERRRAGNQPQQMGIDISDAFGRSSGDFEDFKFDEGYRRTGSGWGVASFEARKQNLLDYIELDIAEVNNVIDYKESVHSTGVSQYTPRINKPFKAFGAIFRLEGLIVDVSGLQMLAWKKVAESNSLKVPEEEDVPRASVVRPEVAVAEIFYWTDDVLESTKLARAFREEFSQVFDAWAANNGYTMPQESESATRGLAIGEDLFEPETSKEPVKEQRKDSQEKQQVEDSYNAWTRTAEVLELRLPGEAEIFTAMEVSPDVAVAQIFRWSNVPIEVQVIVEVYSSILSGDDRNFQGGDDELGSLQSLNEDALMEMHYMAWTRLAEEKGFRKPFPDEVAAAFVLNDPQVAVIDGFGWTVDERIATTLANEFHGYLDSYILEETGIKVETGKTPNEDAVAILAEPEAQLSGPSESDLFQVHFKAWTEAAEIHGLYPPTESEVQMAMKLGPEEAIQRLLQWTSKPEEIKEGTETFIQELKAQADLILGPGNHVYVLPKDRAPVSDASSGVKQPSEDDLVRAVTDSWTAVAQDRGFRIPDTEEIEFSFTVGPEMAVLLAFQWTRNESEADTIAAAYRQELQKRQSRWQGSAPSMDNTKSETKALVSVNPGAPKWVKSLLDVEMQCGIVSHLDRRQVDVLLQVAGLDNIIGPEKRVTASNNYPRDTYQMLGAALRLERRPDHCVVFDSSPHAAIAAHDAEMQSVAFVGAYPRYELLSSDTTSTSFGDLTAMNIRRLFGERVYDQPMLEAKGTEPTKRRKPKTKFFYDDDE